MAEELYAQGPILSKLEGNLTEKQPHKWEVDVDGVGKHDFSVWDEAIYSSVKRGQLVHFKYTEQAPREGSRRRTPYRNIVKLVDGPPAGQASPAPPPQQASQGVSRQAPAPAGEQRQSNQAVNNRPDLADRSWRTGMACKALEQAVQQSVYDTPPNEVLALADLYLEWLRENSEEPLDPAEYCLQHRQPWKKGANTGRTFHEIAGHYCVKGMGLVDAEGSLVG